MRTQLGTALCNHAVPSPGLQTECLLQAYELSADSIDIHVPRLPAPTHIALHINDALLTAVRLLHGPTCAHRHTLHQDLVPLRMSASVSQSESHCNLNTSITWPPKPERSLPNLFAGA